MRCPNCRADNRAARRFCGECGAPLPAACPQCGFDNQSGDLDEAVRFAQELEDFTRPEPLAWCDLFSARGRALAHFGRGRRDDALIAELRRIRDEARRLEIQLALPAIERALAEAATASGEPSSSRS